MKLSTALSLLAFGFVSLFGVIRLQAAPVSFTGSYATNFDGIGSAGTGMPAGFRSMVMAGGNTTFSAGTPISAAGIAGATVSGTQTLTVWNPGSAALSSGTALFNCGSWGNINDRALGTDPTGTAANAIELSMTNNTGAPLFGVIFSYDLKVLTNGTGVGGTEAAELPGYAFFYSITGSAAAADWTRVNALSLTNSTQGTTAGSGNVTITFPTALTNLGLVYFRWADDNNQPLSPDQMIAIDNIVIVASTNRAPTVSITSPANGTSFEAGTNITIAADAADTNGTVVKVEFFANAAKLGESTNAPYGLTWSNVALGTYALTTRATDNDGAVATSSAVNINVVPDLGVGAVYFDGVNDYVTFGPATAGLGVSNFTVECWFKRMGPGVSTSTGTGGVTAYPLVTKGRGEADASNVDCNYFLGFNTSGQLTADFEDFNNGLNHPITGVTPIISNSWQHAAVTYDVASGTWVLYLNGVADATNVIVSSTNAVRTPRYDSIQHAGLATAMTSAGAAAGFFNGKLDEVRIWNYARSGSEILSNYQQQLAGLPGLVGRWSLDETNGTSVFNSGSSGVNGTLTGGPLFAAGFPFDNPPPPVNPPNAPLLVAPAVDETGVTNYPVLMAGVSDPNTNNTLTVTFYGRVANTSAGPDFTLIALPDTQFYSQTYSNIFVAQTEWIITNRTLLNIPYVAQLGDCVQNGDNGGNDVEWRNATNALYRLENPLTTLLANGIPYGVAVGNHDQSPEKSASGTTTFYNQYLGTNHFDPYAYYGGNFGTNNDNHYDLFSASGMDFVVIYFEYDETATSTNAAVYAWANNLLQTYSNRQAIVVSHWIMNSGLNGSFGAQGQTIYNALKGNTNLSLMLCGHINPNGEGRRSDTFNGRTVWTLLSDYQDLVNGGNGWLRTYTFSPANNVIRAKTYSPWLDQFQTGSASQFEIPYLMTPTNPFTQIGVLSGVASGSTASITWPGLATNTTYEWYVTVSDGQFTTTGPLWRFTTGTNAGPVPPTVTLISPTNGASFLSPALVALSASAADVDGVVSNVAFYAGATKLADVAFGPVTFNFNWTGMAPGSYALKAVATDDTGLSRTSAVANISVVSPALTRGPYLQLSTPTSIVVRWRTDVASSSRVAYGTTFGSFTLTNFDSTPVTEHIVTLTNLSPDTRYYYSIGTGGPDTNLFFLTHPIPGTPKPVRIWVIGDAGTGNANQASVRNAFYNWNGTNAVHGWLQLGDNAYDSGLDSEFQANMFNVYTNLLRNSVTWPTLGNHETGQSTAFVDTYAHFQVFTLPTAGEAGGVPSGTEHYYSFDLGMVHFVCLDSMTANRATNGAMANWLRTDLMANTNRWLIAFWHHPPYTKGSHNSDTETELIQMRQNFNPILEAGGVDLVLSGHSHCYERSFLIDGHYGLSTTFTTNLIVQPGSGRETSGAGAYLKPENLSGNPSANHGAIYAVAGSSGQTSGGSLNHPAMFLSLNNLGSMVLDISSNRLDARFLRETGATNDWFTILKTPGGLPPNGPPIAQNASFVRAPGLTLKINIASLLTNYSSDPDSDPRALRSVGLGTQGAAITTNTSFIFYNPSNNAPDTFSYSVTDGRGGNASANINVLVVNPGGMTLATTAVAGVVNVNFAGIPGFLYDVQHSTNLVDWTIKATLTAPPNGLFPYMETNPPSPSFYRLMQH